jgi:hypothetical protein
VKLTRTENGVVCEPETPWEREVVAAIVKAKRSYGVTVEEQDRPHSRSWPPGADEVDLFLKFGRHPWDREER